VKHKDLHTSIYILVHFALHLSIFFFHTCCSHKKTDQHHRFCVRVHEKDTVSELVGRDDVTPQHRPVHHLATSFLVADSINHGIMLEKNATLQLLYYYYYYSHSSALSAPVYSSVRLKLHGDELGWKCDDL
jgi:hypothetical protein